MSLDLGKFSAEINKYDLARANLFQVEFPTSIGKNGSFRPKDPKQDFNNALGSAKDFIISNAQGRSPILRKISGIYSPDLIRSAGLGNQLDKILGNPDEANTVLGLFVRTVNIPGITIETAEHRNDVVPYSTPIGVSTSDFAISFMCQPSLPQRDFFDSWSKMVMDNNNQVVGFYDDYVANIRIYTFDRGGNKQTTTEIVEAYPISVSDIELSYEGASEVIVFSVGFKYRKVVTGKSEDSRNVFNEIRSKFNTINTIVNNL